MANLPEGWTVEGRKAYGRFGERYEVKSDTRGGWFKPTGQFGWPYTITVELNENGDLDINVDDQLTSPLAHGCEMSCSVPGAVLLALLDVNK